MKMSIDDRRNQFLDWAKGHLESIEALECNSGKRSPLQEIKKTALLSLLETLAVAFEGGGKNKSRQAFVQLVEKRGRWEDATRVSGWHLKRALDLHLSKNQDVNCTWLGLREFTKDKYDWKNQGERKGGVDPTYAEIKSRWPEGQNLSLEGRDISLDNFKHSYLLYEYRNRLVHESREQTFSYEKDADQIPMYLTLGRSKKDRSYCEYHLVYPVGFLTKLAKNCIATLRCEAADEDPYAKFTFGQYLIPCLNEPP